METRELTCIGCPLGCSLKVTLENGEVTDVTGNTCKRGVRIQRESSPLLSVSKAEKSIWFPARQRKTFQRA